MRGTPGLPCEGRPGACEAPAPPCDRGRSPLGAPLWRFSARVRVSGPTISCGSTCSELLAARVVVPGERFPSLPSPWLRATAAGRQCSLHLQDRLRTAPLMNEHLRYVANDTSCVKKRVQKECRKIRDPRMRTKSQSNQMHMRAAACDIVDSREPPPAGDRSPRHGEWH